jgi:dTDP-4-dehydrorhamnose 3,5-epimerase
MRVQSLSIPDVLLITPERFGDHRGYLAETFQAARYAEIGLVGPFVQENQSFSRAKGTVRGLHFQAPPAGQGKLVRCIRGAIFDVAVDIRRGSPTYGRHVSAILTSDNGDQLWVPVGFAHGFCTLEPDCEVLYKTTAYYDRPSERGIAYDDPSLAIPWPVDSGEAILSDKDKDNPSLAALPDYFVSAV